MTRLLVALGSSFAAGPTLGPVADPDASRSARNYPHLLAGLLGCDLVDLTVSGATTATILDQPQTTPTGAVFPPQIEGVPADADLVTITAGGNDLGFIGSMLAAAWRRTDPSSPFGIMLGREFPDGPQPPRLEQVAAAADGLARIVDAVRTRAPRARVLLVDYLTVVPPSGVRPDDAVQGAGSRDALPSGELPFDESELTVFRVIQAALASAYVEAAERTGAELVRVSSSSVNHALGSEDPWVAPFRRAIPRTGGSFHPTLAGMAAVAEAVVAALGVRNA